MQAQATQTLELLDWYDLNARSLPWRIEPKRSKNGVKQDPYRVWLSEIMLQQTTVATVTPYFEKFTAAWPRVQDIAAASDQEIRAAWAGLGYYRRAANLHACAKEVAARGGRFPSTAAELIKLPGIGAYTSAAIASIAFGEAVPVVDGNVERVISRLCSIDTPLPNAKAEITVHLGQLVPDDRPGDFAQALMDLGATICKPKAPECGKCPWEAHCTAKWAGNVEDFPNKPAKRPKPSRYGSAIVKIRPTDGALWCEVRADEGLLPGMTQVPTSDWRAEAPLPARGDLLGQVSHTFTHFQLTLDVYSDDNFVPEPGTGFWCKPADLGLHGWPTVMIKVLQLADPRLARLARSKVANARAK
ncbi:MAG: A/G-specific adenine glycosylase [Pseudomonadota bacterium]